MRPGNIRLGDPSNSNINTYRAFCQSCGLIRFVVSFGFCRFCGGRMEIARPQAAIREEVYRLSCRYRMPIVRLQCSHSIEGVPPTVTKGMRCPEHGERYALFRPTGRVFRTSMNGVAVRQQ